MVHGANTRLTDRLDATDFLPVTECPELIVPTVACGHSKKKMVLVINSHTTLTVP